MKQILAVLSLVVLSAPFAKAQQSLMKDMLPPSPPHVQAPLGAKQVRKSMDDAAQLSDADKADRFDKLLTADYLHFEYAVYSSDEECAPREVEELDTLQKDLAAVDSVLFPSVDPSYEALVTKAAADFKKLRDKDQTILNELHN